MITLSITWPNGTEREERHPCDDNQAAVYRPLTLTRNQRCVVVLQACDGTSATFKPKGIK